MAKAVLKGDKELIRTFRRMAAAPQGKALDVVAFDSLQPLAQEMSNRAPVQALRTGVAVVRKASYGPRRREFWVSFRRGVAMRIAHLVELGTQPHSMAKGASVRKGLLQDQPPWSPGTPPRPFARPAFENRKDEVLRRVSTGLWNLITSAASRK